MGIQGARKWAMQTAAAAIVLLCLAGCTKSCDELSGTWIPFGIGQVYLPPYFSEIKPLKVAPEVRRFSGPSDEHLESCNQIPFHNGIVYVGPRSGMPAIQPGMAGLGTGTVLVDIGNGLQYAAVDSKDMEAAGFEVATIVSGDAAVLITGRGAHSHAKVIAATYRVQ